MVEGKAKHTIQSIQTATRSNTQSKNTTSIIACRTVIISSGFCVQNKSDLHILCFKITRYKMPVIQKMDSTQS